MSEYRKAMAGIGNTVAMQVIRKIVRGKDSDLVKFSKIRDVIHEYEADLEKNEDWQTPYNAMLKAAGVEDK